MDDTQNNQGTGMPTTGDQPGGAGAPVGGGDQGQGGQWQPNQGGESTPAPEKPAETPAEAPAAPEAPAAGDDQHQA